MFSNTVFFECNIFKNINQELFMAFVIILFDTISSSAPGSLFTITTVFFMFSADNCCVNDAVHLVEVLQISCYTIDKRALRTRDN